MNDAVIVADALAGIPGASIRRGVYVGVDSGMALVDMGDSRFPCEFGTGYIPVVGDVVLVVSIGPRHLVVPAGAKPHAGTIVTVSPPSAVVATLAGNITAVIVGTAPTSGDRVALYWTEDGPLVLGKLATTPVAPEPPVDPGTAPALRSATFRATHAGSTDRGAARWWQSQPWASNTTYGAWFYGNAIKDTIPAGATFVSLEFKVNRVQDSGGPPRFALHNAGAPTSSLPGFSGYTEWDPPNGWQVPPDPAGWFAALKAGGAWSGIGLNQGGWNKFASLPQDSESGALRISWKE